MNLILSRVFSSVLVIVLCSVITAAFGYQIITGQNPCPLCFLQRVAMIGIALGQVLNFRFGYKMSHHAISLFQCLFGAAVSLRQLGLHICPGFPTFGTPVLGYGLYTWAFIVFVCALIVIGLLMWLYNPNDKGRESQSLNALERIASIYLFMTIVADMIATGMICGWVCPDNP